MLLGRRGVKATDAEVPPEIVAKSRLPRPIPVVGRGLEWTHFSVSTPGIARLRGNASARHRHVTKRALLAFESLLRSTFSGDLCRAFTLRPLGSTGSAARVFRGEQQGERELHRVHRSSQRQRVLHRRKFERSPGE